MKEAYLYKKVPNKRVQCRACSHYCLIKEGETGKCGVRENRKGILYSLVYGKPCVIQIDPIEKKPFFHFLPGSQSLSLATVGCNFACHACQNWTISQGPKISEQIEGQELGPEKIIETALKNRLPSISYTYTEPTVFLEYALDTMKLAKKAGLKNTWVTNGFLSKETLTLLFPYLDAANVDLKSFDDKFYQEVCGGRLQPVLDNLKRLKENKIWLEITTLVIPALNDSEEIFKNIAQFIKKELGEKTPWHISRFYGAISWKLQHLPETPIKTLKKAWQIGKQAGLKYVYTGNVPGLESENTFCPKCSAKMIERIGYAVQRFDKNGHCSQCSADLNLIVE